MCLNIGDVHISADAVGAVVKSVVSYCTSAEPIGSICSGGDAAVYLFTCCC